METKKVLDKLKNKGFIRDQAHETHIFWLWGRIREREEHASTELSGVDIMWLIDLLGDLPVSHILIINKLDDSFQERE